MAEISSGVRPLPSWASTLAKLVMSDVAQWTWPRKHAKWIGARFELSTMSGSALRSRRKSTRFGCSTTRLTARLSAVEPSTLSFKLIISAKILVDFFRIAEAMSLAASALALLAATVEGRALMWRTVWPVLERASS